MTVATIWILLSVWCSAVGWTLSALHALNGRGYLLALAVTIGGAVFLKKWWWPTGGFHGPRWGILWRRFRRPAPFIFLCIAVLALVSGLCRLPENGDSNAYRVPRIYHWLAESHWHWIRTEDSRENIAGCGYEWLCAPLLLLRHSERWFFLPNVIPYFLLPGMLFSFFRRLRVAARAAWWWSWLVATGWCYVFQACSTDNDALCTIYALAAVTFAFRARETKKFSDFGMAVLSAAILNGVKPVNLPLLLPCFVALCPSWRIPLRHPLASTALGVVAALASFLPTAFFNWQNTGTWTGFGAESGPAVWWHWGSTQAPQSPGWAIVGNTFYLTVQNLLPPFFPWAGAWNGAMSHFLQTPLGAHFASFEAFGRLNRSVSATSAGLGLSLVIAITASIVPICAARKPGSPRAPLSFHSVFCWTPWIALLVFMAKVGTIQNARFLAAFYPLLLLPLVRRPGMDALVRRRWWRMLVLTVMSFTLAFAGFHYGRALVPSSAFAWLQHSPRPGFLKILDDYYQTRLSVEAYRKFTTQHSANETVVGYSSLCCGLEPGMWQPWGHGKVERVRPDDTPQWARARGITHIFIEDPALQVKNETIEQWLQEFDAEVVDQMAYTTDPGAPLTHLYFCHLRPPDKQ